MAKASNMRSGYKAFSCSELKTYNSPAYSNLIFGERRKPIKKKTNLAVAAEYSMSSDRTEEHEGYSNLNDKGGHHTQLVPPARQEVHQRSHRCWDALRLIMQGQSCFSHIRYNYYPSPTLLTLINITALST